LPVGDSEAHYFTARLVAEYFDKLGENVINKPLGLKETVQAFEIMVIREPLALTEWNQSKAAKVLNVKLTTLNAKIHRYRITLRRHLDSISQPRD
jgi:transcriptional regulator with PAS, ATPase and Fis domain